MATPAHLDPVDLTPEDKVTTAIEHRRAYSLERCELNVYETRKATNGVHLTFGGFTITSMLRGKKVLHDVGENAALDYVPGQTMLVPHNGSMDIDFPDASPWRPTQCTALVIEQSHFTKQLDYLNEQRPMPDGQAWSIDPNRPFLQNDDELARLSDRMVRVLSGTDPLKDILGDLLLKEIVLALIRLQNRADVFNNGADAPWNLRFKAVVEHIRRNLTEPIAVQRLCELAGMSRSAFYRAFTDQFGMGPNQLVLHERINYAKQLLGQRDVPIKEVCYASGFSDPNYFARLFKKMEGITPGEFRNAG
ncbi:MAG: helix-turn-helix domain-containing protein [Flavobacteriales bacterium]|nr:helix-turn-helix domain-containing protein [Flavobacteriales bacterium]